MTRDQRLDASLAARCAREPYFAESWHAARVLLRSAVYGVDMRGADVLKWSNGATCRDGRCTCCGPCLHTRAWALYSEEVRR